MKKYLSFVVTIAFILLFIVYALLNPALISDLVNIEWQYLLVIALMQVAMVFTNGLFTKFALELFSKKMGHKESFFISLISTIGNYFTPFRGGAGIRAVYLKQKFDFSYSLFISTLSGYYIITFFINSLIGLSALTIFSLRGQSTSPLVYIFFGMVFIANLLLIIFSPPVERIKRIKTKLVLFTKMKSIFLTVLTGWHIIIKDKKVLMKLISVTLINYLIVSIIAFSITNSLNISMNIVELSFYVALGNMSLLISITPGSIGIKESLYLLTSGIIGLSNQDILQIALIDRGILFFVLGISYIILKLLDLNLKKIQ